MSNDLTYPQVAHVRNPLSKIPVRYIAKRQDSGAGSSLGQLKEADSQAPNQKKDQSPQGQIPQVDENTKASGEASSSLDWLFEADKYGPPEQPSAIDSNATPSSTTAPVPTTEPVSTTAQVSTTAPALKPFFKQGLLNEIEASIANDEEYIELKNANCQVFRVKNPYRGLGSGDLAPGEKERRAIVMFQGERDLKRLEAQGKADQFFPAYNGSTLFHGPNKSEEETRATFERVTRQFEVSQEAAAITSLIHTHLKGCAVNKVIAFGLGCIGHVRPGPPQTFYEHAAAKVVWRAVKAVSSAPEVSLLVQEPLYTNVCVKVLRDSGFNIIKGFGAMGFAIVDDSTVVLAHHPSFPLREIIADIARPALISMRAQEPADGPTQQPQGLLDFRADVDSVRSRKMLEEYRAVSLGVPKQKAFWENTWYVRNTNANPSE
ncbi:hypothetical protein F4859DRAFT_511933 [Xylaria cf. heliscus]|nr:hypothetical protein F4859DRAFT_511933 [Xylaria cf. heliscus]